MANDFFSQLYAGTGLGDYLKDWKHASKIFVGNNFRLSPKYSFLFHVAIDIDPQLTKLQTTDILEAGMLVKSAQLPKYTVENKTYNAYNRKNIVQQAIKYDPITITFHDDSFDVIRDLWYDYMSYYYRDSDYTKEQYRVNDKYNTRQNQNWGFTPDDAYVRGQKQFDNRLIKSIRLYSLHQKQFSEYILINPVISGFQHGQHTQGQNETLEHTMTLQYEAVLYGYGSISGQTPQGFATLHYDSTPSPLGIPSLAGSVLDAIAPSVSQGLVGDIVNGLTGRGQKLPEKIFRGHEISHGSAGTGIGALLSQIALGISKGNNPLQNLTVPTIAGYGQTLFGSGGGLISGGGIGGSLSGFLNNSGGPSFPSGATPNLNIASASATGIGFANNASAPVSPGAGANSNGEQVVEANQFTTPKQNFTNIGTFTDTAVETQTLESQGSAFGSTAQNFTNIGGFPDGPNTGTE